MRIQSHQPPAIIATLTRSLAVPFLILSLLSGSICLAAGSDLLSVTDYGATGNGVTDDAPAIATAIAVAVSDAKPHHAAPSRTAPHHITSNHIKPN